MRYLSTRGGVGATALGDAILAGLAPDGGLFVPAMLPRIDGAMPASFARADAASGEAIGIAARRAIAPFFAGSALEDELAAITDEAFTFDAPLRATHDPSLDVLELFHGPTAAFKDFGARFLAATLRRLRADDARELTVLVATSGDTGSAVGAAFHRMPGVRVVILYPDGRVSPRQAHQLGCFGDNVVALRVDGSFDDCQRLVKRAFADAALRAARPLGSANSISLGRLLPQMSYYLAAAWRHAPAADDAPINFVVPTGNLGNAFAALLARACGAPIGEIVLATNANRVLPDFLRGAPYAPAPSRATLANAMDVGDPSNVERLRWLHRDDASLRATIRADSVDDATIAATIRAGESRYGHTWCPHTACAVAVAERLRARGDGAHWCVVATAHPAKFDTVVEPLVGHAVAPPPALAAMLARASEARPLPADEAALREYLMK